MQLTGNWLIIEHINYSPSLPLHVALQIAPTLSAVFPVSQQLLPACLSPCGSGAGGGGAGREYELPGRKADRKEGRLVVFCLEECCQHSENGWGETGERWDWQLQPTFIHPSHPLNLSPSRSLTPSPPCLPWNPWALSLWAGAERSLPPPLWLGGKHWYYLRKENSKYNITVPKATDQRWVM